jgi:hypothetical protein
MRSFVIASSRAARTFVLTGVAVVSATASFAQNPAPVAPLDPQGLKSIDSFIAREMVRQGIPGLAVGIYSRGQILLAKGYGQANVELGVPVKPETMFNSGSVGKQFVSAAIMMLVEEGKVSLDDSLTKYFPDAPGAWKPILVKNLLSHTSGLAEYESEDRTGPKGPFYIRLDFTEDELVTEQVAAKAQQEAEESARIAADPVASYQAVANAEAIQNLELVAHGVLHDEYLAQFGTVARGQTTHEQMDAAIKAFKAEFGFVTNARAEAMTEFINRHMLSHGSVESYRIAAKVLSLWGLLPEHVAPTPTPVVEVVLTPRERAAEKKRAYHNDIIATDWTGRKWTEKELDDADSSLALKVRRYEESGHQHSENERYTEFLSRKDEQARQANETNRIAADEDQRRDYEHHRN